MDLGPAALEVALLELGLVLNHDVVVGEYEADMIVNNVVLLELKSVVTLMDAHHAQMPDYLKSTEIEAGLLLNFGRQAEFHRKIFDTSRKGSLNWTKDLKKKTVPVNSV